MLKLVAHPRFPFLATSAACFGLVGAGVLMAHFLNLAACPLCIIQRMLYLLLGLVSVAGIITGARRGVAFAMAAIAATGAFAAGYQVWIQRFARDTNCSANSPWWERLVDWAGEQVPWLFQASGLCSDPAWKFLGLSIAEWSLALFTSLLGLALYAALKPRP